MNKKLYRSDENKVLLGICGGIGEYFDVDPAINKSHTGGSHIFRIFRNIRLYSSCLYHP